VHPVAHDNSSVPGAMGGTARLWRVRSRMADVHQITVVRASVHAMRARGTVVRLWDAASASATHQRLRGSP